MTDPLKLQIDLGLPTGTRIWFDIGKEDEVAVQTTMTDDSVAWPTSTLTIKVSQDKQEAYGFDEVKPTAGAAVVLTGEQITEPLNVTAYKWLCAEITAQAASSPKFADVFVFGRPVALGN